MALRVIAGSYGGRRLNVPDAPDLRPTGSRVRETLFNWLGERTVGSRVLDLFAGTGILGIEALSRGAEEAVFVERSGRLAGRLSANLTRLGIERARVIRGDARRYLRDPANPYDLVFLDPPFKSAIIDALCTQLEQAGWLAPGALVYLEYDSHAGRPELPANWSVVRQRQAGGVGYALASR